MTIGGCTYAQFMNLEGPICPYCKAPCDAPDMVDVGVGMIQCGPAQCPICLASEIGPYDEDRVLTIKEQETGWYEPRTPVSSLANTCHGSLVDHKTAKRLYELGLLDKK